MSAFRYLCDDEWVAAWSFCWIHHLCEDEIIPRRSPNAQSSATILLIGILPPALFYRSGRHNKLYSYCDHGTNSKVFRTNRFFFHLHRIIAQVRGHNRHQRRNWFLNSAQYYCFLSLVTYSLNPATTATTNLSYWPRSMAKTGSLRALKRGGDGRAADSVLYGTIVPNYLCR